MVSQLGFPLPVAMKFAKPALIFTWRWRPADSCLRLWVTDISGHAILRHDGTIEDANSCKV
ncbi:Glutamate Receptor-Interacting Protein 2 [Manis pentadactyla]|nr:Glutamate Receptor-Interacting Protein 2 [Manis pentadactyla]